jgi:serine/threonine protein kinase
MIGRTFMGRYEAVRLLGEGGMGRVYLARDLRFNRQVVVKVMHEHIAEDPKFRERFSRETQLMAKFQHQHAVTFHDANLDEPHGACIIMEYIKGINLDTLLQKNGRFTAARVGRVVAQLCEVLQAAHDDGIIHRDLKPANLMVVDADTPREKVKVMDFGLAKILDHAGQLKKVTDTNLDFAVGTPGYICPEQVRGEEMDHRGDLYSVGCIMYELLTGRLPFLGPASMDMLLAHATEVPPPFAEVGMEGWVPAAVEELVMKCLAKEPHDRPQCARELAELYEQALVHGDRLYPDEAAPLEGGPAGGSGVVSPSDPNALVFTMDAWMPEKIAIIKMRGFVHDVGGDVVESVPGRIRVRLTTNGKPSGRGGSPRSSGGALGWLGIGRRNRPIDLELRFDQPDPKRENQLHITVTFRPPDSQALHDTAWRQRCTQLFIDVRAYLMGV